MKKLFLVLAVLALAGCSTYAPTPGQVAKAKDQRQIERDVEVLRRANNDAMKTIGGF